MNPQTETPSLSLIASLPGELCRCEMPLLRTSPAETGQGFERDPVVVVLGGVTVAAKCLLYVVTADRMETSSVSAAKRSRWEKCFSSPGRRYPQCRLQTRPLAEVLLQPGLETSEIKKLRTGT